MTVISFYLQGQRNLYFKKNTMSWWRVLSNQMALFVHRVSQTAFLFQDLYQTITIACMSLWERFPVYMVILQGSVYGCIWIWFARCWSSVRTSFPLLTTATAPFQRTPVDRSDSSCAARILYVLLYTSRWKKDKIWFTWPTWLAHWSYLRVAVHVCCMKTLCTL